MLKKNIFLLLILLFFLVGLYSQSQVQAISAEVKDENSTSSESVETELDTKWLLLQNLSGSEYEEMFLALLLEPLSLEKFQSYVLAESLWYVTHFENNSSENSSVTRLKETVDEFLSNLGTGVIIPQEYSDTVYSMFRYFANNQQVPFSVPELNIFLATETLHIPTEEIKSVQMYRGGIALEKIKKEIQVDSSYEKIDVMSILSNPPLLYALQYSSDMETLYQNVLDFANALPEDSRPLIIKCWDLLNQLKKISLQHGFPLVEILPVFSSTLIKEIQKDDFVLCCLSQQDLEKLVTDLEGLILFSTIYHSRITKELYSGNEIAVDENGGSL